MADATPEEQQQQQGFDVQAFTTSSMTLAGNLAGQLNGLVSEIVKTSTALHGAWMAAAAENEALKLKNAELEVLLADAQQRPARRPPTPNNVTKMPARKAARKKK